MSAVAAIKAEILEAEAAVKEAKENFRKKDTQVLKAKREWGTAQNELVLQEDRVEALKRALQILEDA